METKTRQETMSTRTDTHGKQKPGGSKSRSKPGGEAQDATENAADPKASTTVFVSNLSTTVDSAALLKSASSIGPVRAAFIVCNPSTSESRGFGYVRFVLREDAETALKDGLGAFEGQEKSVLLTWAKPKLNPDQRIQKQQEKTASKLDRVKKEVDRSQTGINLKEKKEASKSSKFKSKKDFAANRVVVLQGLPIPDQKTSVSALVADGQNDDDMDVDNEDAPTSNQGQVGSTQTQKQVTTKALYKRARKLGKLESVEYPILGPSTASSACAHFIFADPTAAAIAQSKLHGHVFKGYFITTAMKARLDATTRLGHAFGGRLIIRNLQFDVTEQDLRYLFAPFGPLHSIDIPCSEADGQSKPRGRGFAFVWMLSEADAARAIEGLNGKKVHAGIALEAIKKDTDGEKKSVKRKSAKAEEQAGERGRVMAVDWALSKKQYQEAEEAEKQKEDGNPELTTEESGSESGDEDEDQDEASSDFGEEETASEDEFDQFDITGISHSDLEETEENEGKKKNTRERNDPGVTLFIRNLSFEATEDELHTLFRPFGPLRYARIVMDPKLKRSRGTGFVCLWNKEDAQKILDLVQKLESEGVGHGPLAANGLPSLLQPDPSSSLAAQLSLHGRVLGISEAVSRDQAEKLRIDRDKSGEGKDKRNLFLMKEGVIFPNSHEARGLHPADLAARQQSFDQRKALLRSNLSLYISHTRLSIRQLPIYVSERCLKRLARHALDEWRREVKANKRTELTSEELSRKDRDRQGTGLEPPARSEKKRLQSKVKQVKILRTNEKLDGLSGLGKSKGYGFVEMENHADALRVLRWANANPIVDRLLKIWTCEELEKTIKRYEAGESNPKDETEETGENSKGDTDERRLVRLKAKLEELQAEVKILDNNRSGDGVGVRLRNEEKALQIKAHRMLIIEFAIENAQTVKKRSELRQKSRDKMSQDPRKAIMQEPENEGSGSGPTLKRKRGEGSDISKKKFNLTSPNKIVEQTTGEINLGRVIGRKRKQKKSKG